MITINKINGLRVRELTLEETINTEGMPVRYLLDRDEFIEKGDPDSIHQSWINEYPINNNNLSLSDDELIAAFNRLKQLGIIK